MTKRNKRGNLQDKCDQPNNQDDHCYDQAKKQPKLTEINYRRTNIYSMQIKLACTEKHLLKQRKLITEKLNNKLQKTQN